MKEILVKEVILLNLYLEMSVGDVVGKSIIADAYAVTKLIAAVFHDRCVPLECVSTKGTPRLTATYSKKEY